MDLFNALIEKPLFEGDWVIRHIVRRDPALEGRRIDQLSAVASVPNDVVDDAVNLEFLLPLCPFRIAANPHPAPNRITRVINYPVARLILGQVLNELVIDSIGDNPEHEIPCRANLLLDLVDLNVVRIRNDDLDLPVAVCANHDFLGAAGVDSVAEDLHHRVHIDSARVTFGASRHGLVHVDLIDQDHAAFEIDAQLWWKLQRDDDGGERQYSQDHTDLPAVFDHSQALGDHAAQQVGHDNSRQDDGGQPIACQLKRRIRLCEESQRKVQRHVA